MKDLQYFFSDSKKLFTPWDFPERQLRYLPQHLSLGKSNWGQQKVAVIPLSVKAQRDKITSHNHQGIVTTPVHWLFFSMLRGLLLGHVKKQALLRVLAFKIITQLERTG